MRTTGRTVVTIWVADPTSFGTAYGDRSEFLVPTMFCIKNMTFIWVACEKIMASMVVVGGTTFAYLGNVDTCFHFILCLIWTESRKETAVIGNISDLLFEPEHMRKTTVPHRLMIVYIPNLNKNVWVFDFLILSMIIQF